MKRPIWEYYIQINAHPKTFELDQYGKCIVVVYKNLDYSKQQTVEHCIRVGNFEINAGDMNVEDFLREIRQGIEKIISADKTAE